MKTKRITQSNRLGSYLTATLGTSLLAAVQSDAAIVTIDIGPSGFNIAGPNGNVPLGYSSTSAKFPMAGGGTLFIGNNYDSADRKVYGIGGMGIQFASAGTLSSPTKFSSIMLIGSSATFFSEAQYSVFSMYDYDAPDFGSGSFMGFKTVQGNYGWLEVTWTGSTNQFQILGGAYESVAGEPILTPTAIPEPASVLSTMGLLASGLLIRRRKRAA